jgi:hypothetical protein
MYMNFEVGRMIISDMPLSFGQQALLHRAAESEIRKNHRN